MNSNFQLDLLLDEPEIVYKFENYLNWILDSLRNWEINVLPKLVGLNQLTKIDMLSSSLCENI